MCKQIFPFLPSYVQKINRLHRENVSDLPIRTKTKKLAPPKEEPVAITPEAMNSMLVKETKEEALEKRMRRKSIVVQVVSATAPGNNNNNNFLYLGNAVISHSSPRPF